ncbi:RsmB/NOP family class I SAM-dependent RNA methyltransferase [Szabonella alba]|uniref:RsmB/NOP family class I SAM-dependent RNA methyltransferase n=1 Tax=Szabonella alba TaxID=2804194 RepID=A0A8K0VE42_9RHOB|nr:RsmB/NOP family class I SAM-dependent RNA methyltransferase [Szabonella alba]MBL4917637.1 RsmB/NOP family class I SAM-dependent RNA methyltransferase [Szabonella alba]
MTPAARHAAAIGILDRWLAGEAAEKALTNWARTNRYAGSGDRAAIRDIVFQSIRCRRSFAHLSGAETGRGLILGALRAAQTDPATVFTGDRFAPAPLTDAEFATETALPPAPSGNVALDCPDWLRPLLDRALGDQALAVLEALRHRAPVFLRVNSLRATVDQAVAALQAEGIDTRPAPLSPRALEVTGNARRVQTSAAFAAGLVELQDAASQAVVDLLPLTAGARVLDLCAGGGGKSLAMAARMSLQIFAHDIDAGRLSDLPARAGRAGAPLHLLDDAEGPERMAPFDLVLADAPCSGSGSWRRAPEAKWRLTAERLTQLCAIQDSILTRAAALVAPGGVLAYATCSLLEDENSDRIAAFLDRHPDWRCDLSRQFTPLDGADGFFAAILRRVD